MNVSRWVQCHIARYYPVFYSTPNIQKVITLWSTAEKRFSCDRAGVRVPALRSMPVNKNELGF